jgi:hypothetical protein
MRTDALPDLHAAFEGLYGARRRAVQIALCRHALGVWEAYLRRYGPVEYVDSVVGLYHCVDSSLPRDALADVEAGVDRAGVAQRYLEPIVALQDDDLELPGHIELAYYAIYNLHRRAVEGAAIDDWLIVNQALAAEEDPALWRRLLADALQAALRWRGGQEVTPATSLTGVRQGERRPISGAEAVSRRHARHRARRPHRRRWPSGR